MRYSDHMRSKEDKSEGSSPLVNSHSSSQDSFHLFFNPQLGERFCLSKPVILIDMVFIAADSLR